MNINDSSGAHSSNSFVMKTAHSPYGEISVAQARFNANAPQTPHVLNVCPVAAPRDLFRQTSGGFFSGLPSGND